MQRYELFAKLPNYFLLIFLKIYNDIAPNPPSSGCFNFNEIIAWKNLPGLDSHQSFTQENR